jgi:hypothetical protein
MSSSCDGVLPAGFAAITASTVSAGLGHLHQGSVYKQVEAQNPAQQQELQQHGGTYASKAAHTAHFAGIGCVSGSKGL